MKIPFKKTDNLSVSSSTTTKNGQKPQYQNELDKKLVYSLSENKLPKPKQLKHLKKTLSKKELWLVRVAALIILISLIFLGVKFYLANFLPTPIVGGEHTEGLIGAPQYVNPLLSQTNDVDSDLANLIFSGLLKYDKDLNLVPDLASEYQISEDQKAYTFTLRQNVLWHDSNLDDPKQFTANDVIFTVESILDPDFKSPILPSLRGVEIQKIDDYTIAFTLPEAFPPFLEALTFGILPEHIWLEVPPANANLNEYNIKPVGTGMWQFVKLNKDSLGNIKSYILEPNPNYYGQKPYLEKLTFKFYPDFETAVDSLKSKSVGGISFLPKRLKDDLKNSTNLNFHSFNLPQYTAIFFNQKQNEILKNKGVRSALRLAIDKPTILSEALRLEGQIIDGPILPGYPGYGPSQEDISYNPQQANQTLEDTGWKQLEIDDYKKILEEEFNKIQGEKEKEKADAEGEETSPEEGLTEEELTLEEYLESKLVPDQPFYRQNDDKILQITLTTVDQPENLKAAELIANFWQQVGVTTNLNIVEGARVSREVIKPRNYEALLFGIIAGADPDPFPFWHSSQNQDPGLNLANYANRKVDTLLEEARKSTDAQKRQESYSEFQNIIISEIPAIFLFNPTYTYVLDKDIKGIDISRIVIPSDRFNNIEEWYIKTKRKYKKE
ncbi:hypothetical protein KKA15_06295 [Patescibacteria group bacterium]|nr:hypothetical protein [Patescibacteria group bacterium]